MSTVNRWSKMAGLLNEAAEPQSQEQEVHESTQEIAVSENIMNADKLRSLISEIANEILSEARASNSDVELIQKVASGAIAPGPYQSEAEPAKPAAAIDLAATPLQSERTGALTERSRWQRQMQRAAKAAEGVTPRTPSRTSA